MIKNSVIKHSEHLSNRYMLLGIITLSFYGTQVCPFIDSLPAWVVVLVFSGGFALAWLVKQLFEARWVEQSTRFAIPTRQLIFDLGLFSVVGIGITIFDFIAFDFPFGSGVKVLVGCLAIGCFAAIDNALLRERESIGSATDESASTIVFPITRKLGLAAAGIVILACFVMSLVVIHDITYLTKNIEQVKSSNVVLTIFFDLFFVLAVILLFGWRIMHSFSRNLNILFDLQIEVLNQVEQGCLDTPVPVVTHDEFSVIAAKTNQMISGLKQARDEEAKFFHMIMAISSEIKLERLLGLIMSTASEFLNAERSTIFVHDARTDELWSVVAQGLKDIEIRLPSSKGIAGWVYTTGEVTNIKDVYEDERFDQAMDKESGFRTSSMLAMPVTDRDGNRIGVLQVLNSRAGEFDKHDEKRLKSFCAEVAISLVNAKLFEDVNNTRKYNESILKSLSDGVVTLDEDNRITKVNEAAMKLMQLDDSVVGSHADESFTGDNSWVMETVNRVNENGQAVLSVDASFLRAENDSASLNMTTVPLLDLNDERIGAMLVMEDITAEKRVRNTMSRYLTKQVADRVLAGGNNDLGGVTNEVSVLFSDIRDFTTISETLGARATVSMLNDYFGVMVDPVFDNAGILDKYIGDAIMAVYGAPFTSEQDTDNAVISAMQMLTALVKLNQHRVNEGQAEIRIGIGISSGEAVVGNIGSPKRMDYTVIGDTVNLAARLEGLTKFFGIELLISETTKDKLNNDYKLRELDMIRVKGKEQPVRVYEVLDYKTEDSFPNMAKTLASYNEGIQAYNQQRWRDGVHCFDAALECFPGDRPSQIYRQRCQQFINEPPADNWDGVWTFTQK